MNQINPKKPYNSEDQYDAREKKFEIALHSRYPRLGLNLNGCWDRVVKAANAHIVSKTSNRYLDAYLLSESSLFVWEDRIIMITCGKTTPVKALPEILGIIKKKDIAYVLFERKNGKFPHGQVSDFSDDAAFLSEYFDGVSYKFGSADNDRVNIFFSSNTAIPFKKTPSLQVHMHDLDPSVMENFTTYKSKTPDQAAKLSGLDLLYPEAVKDSHLFSPAGYSLNGIIEKKYFTVHVTPHSNSSYVSFETSLIDDDPVVIIRDVISIFKPGKMSILLITGFEQEYLKLHTAVLDAVCGKEYIEKKLDKSKCFFAATYLNASIDFRINNFTALSVEILDDVLPVRLTRISPSNLV